MIKLSTTQEDTEYWRTVEKQAREAEENALRQQNQQNLELSQIVGNIRSGICPKVVEKLKEEITEKIPYQARDKALIEAEVEARLGQLILPYAQRLLQETNVGRIAFKQTNVQQQISDVDQKRKWLRELKEITARIRTQRIKVRAMNLEKLMLDPHEASILSSIIDTSNNLVYLLMENGITGLQFFEPLPMSKNHRALWFRDLFMDNLVPDGELEEQQRRISEIIKRLHAPITV